jgi:hypothetical protein
MSLQHEAQQSAEQQQQAYEATVQKLRQQVQMLQAGLPLGGAEAPSPGTTPPPGCASDTRSASEMYRKYMETHDAWLEERGKVRRLEVYLEQVAGEVAARAASLERERAEREALEAAHSALQESLREASAERQVAERRLEQQVSEVQRLLREKEWAERSVADLQQQVAQLLADTQRLRGEPLAPGSSGGGLSAEQLVTSADQVISAKLVGFGTVQELVLQNRRILSLVRQLSSENERSKAEVRAELAGEWAAREAALRSEAEEQRVLVVQLTAAGSKTADYLRGLQQQLEQAKARAAAVAGAGSAAGLNTASPPGSHPGGSGPHSGPGTPTGAGGPSPGSGGGAADEALLQAQRELDTVKADAGRTTTELQSQLSSLRDQVVSLTTEGQLHKRHLEESRRQVQDLTAQLGTEQKQLQALALDRARMEGLHQTSRDQLQRLKGQLEEAQAQAAAKAQRVVMLEADVGMTQSSLERSNAEVTLLTSEKVGAGADP